jgi:hypothetical protein
MKIVLKLMMAIIAGAVLVGCATTEKEITRMSQSERTDVFTEVQAESAAPAGFVGLLIKASIKTHLKGYYAFESKLSVHGKPGYPFLVNIDGQAVLWKVDGQKDTIPRYDEKGHTSHDPDAGMGMRYNLEKRVRLAAGPHKIFFALPGELYYTEATVSLKEGESSVLEFKPRYREKTNPTRIPTFLEGIESYEILLNGQIFRRE